MAATEFALYTPKFCSAVWLAFVPGLGCPGRQWIRCQQSKTRYPCVKGRKHHCTRRHAGSLLWGLLACDDFMIAGRDACSCRGLGLVTLSIVGQITPLCLHSPTVLLIWSINALGWSCHSLVQCLSCRWVFAYGCSTGDTWGTLSICHLLPLCVQQMIQTTRANPATFPESDWLIPSFLEEGHCRKYSLNLARKAQFGLWFDFMKSLEAIGNIKYCHPSSFLLLLPHPRSCSGRTVCAAFCELGRTTDPVEKNPTYKKI